MHISTKYEVIWLLGSDKINLKEFFKSRNYIQNEKQGPYFDVSAI